MHKPAFLAALVLAVITGCNPAPKPHASSEQAEFSRVPLVVQQREAARPAIHLTVELARTPAQQERGLMFRRSLPDNGGMIFPMDPPRTASFWMKDTLIPLDIVFIRTDGTIAMIAPQTTPHSLAPVSAGIPVAAVLELRGGRARELGLAVGDRLSWGPCIAQQVAVRRPDNFCPAP